MHRRHAHDDTVIYLVGGGIASLAAAAFFIRDGNIKGHNIRILEESARIGGSLDAAGSPHDGYIMRGGRMLESKYLCTYDLFASIPTLDGRQTVTHEIFECNRTMKTASRARLFRGGKSINAPRFGLSEKHVLTIERLELTPERILGRTSISDQFDHSFFETDFWFMWCTTFAFQPWHSAVEFKRYLLRFTHMVSGFNTLSGIMRTVYNQFDSLVRPLRKWLGERGVKFICDIRVTDIDLCHDAEGYAAQRILYEQNGQTGEIRVADKDLVIVTLGSMTESSSLGSMDSAPVLKGKQEGVPGLYGRRSPPASPTAATPLASPTTLKNRSGSPSPQLSTTPPSSTESGISPEMPQEKADFSPSPSPVG
jgi:oleate hydratase